MRSRLAVGFPVACGFLLVVCRFLLAACGLLLAACGFLLAACGGSAPSGGSGPSGGSAPAGLTVTSESFVDGGQIPKSFTCTGGSHVPDIAWSGDLHGASALAVVVDDPDAPGGTFVHRVVLDLPPSTTHLAADPPAGAHQADNSAGTPGWTAPCPPSGTHHYRFTVYGLSKPTGLPDGTAPGKAIDAITSTAVVQGRLTGLVTH